MKLLVYMMDGVGPDYVDCFMPHVSRLPYRGYVREPVDERGSLGTWANLICGTEDHGLYGLLRTPGPHQAYADAKRGTLLWEWTQARGYDTLVVGLMFTHEARPFGGRLISQAGEVCLGMERPDLWLYRDEMWENCDPLPAPFKWTPRQVNLKRLMEYQRQAPEYRNYVERLVQMAHHNARVLASLGGDVLIREVEGTDHSAHNLAWDPALLGRVYHAVDEAFAYLADTLQPEIILALSDHGMMPDIGMSETLRIAIWTMHKQPGMWASNKGFLRRDETMLSIRRRLERLLRRKE